MAVSSRGSFPQLWKRLWKNLSKHGCGEPESQFFGRFRDTKGCGRRKTVVSPL
jgi:hypothetical protein